MAKIIMNSTPRKDGFYMPGEFNPQQRIFMAWPDRCDNWRLGAKPAQMAYKNVALAISKFTPVTILVNPEQFVNARNQLPDYIQVIEMSLNDAWLRDTGPTFLINDKNEMRAIDWKFNAWGGLYDGLYFPWDKDALVAQKICELAQIDFYKPENFVLEGGSFHVDGQGTLITTEMCLLSKGRNPNMTKIEIEETLCEYLNIQKVIWIKDGIDPYETNGHIDDVACFIRPGEVACIYTEDKNHPFYKEAQDAYNTLSKAIDAKGRKLKVHKLTLTKKPIYLKGAETIDYQINSAPRKNGDLCIASYVNFLITNKGVIVPQFDDENDALAISQIESMFNEYEVIGVKTKEIVYGGGNIHCITQQMPKV